MSAVSATGLAQESWLEHPLTDAFLGLLADRFSRRVLNPPSTPHVIVTADGSVSDLMTGFSAPAELVALLSDACLLPLYPGLIAFLAAQGDEQRKGRWLGLFVLAGVLLLAIAAWGVFTEVVPNLA